MSLQYLWNLFSSHPAQVVNGLALFLALAGSWLLLATRFREQRAQAQLATGHGRGNNDLALLDEPTRRINRFFYLFASITLVAALLLSAFSTRL
ncbi:MAG: hypothetical protein LPK18_13260 [Pseudomonadaceae bacterium]|nr:hypothetical protein [Pseudomonadaceae bacterium]